MMSLIKAYCSVVVDKGGWLDCHFRYVRRQAFLSVCVVCVVCVCVCVCVLCVLCVLCVCVCCVCCVYEEIKRHINEVCVYCHDDKHTRLTSFHWSSL